MQQVGKPVTGIDFLGREKELAQITQYVKSGQSVVIIAPRRFGKTSLALEALRRLKQDGIYTAFVDIFSNPDVGSLAKAITGEVLQNNGLKKAFRNSITNLKELVRNVELKATVEEFDFIFGFTEDKKKEWDLLSESLDFAEAFSRKNNKRLVCAIDEFGETQNFDDDDQIIKLFRSKIQLQESTAYIFSGSYESVMQHIFVSPKSPFFRMTRIIRLGYLERGILENHFCEKLTEYDIPANAYQITSYLDISKGHPYYAQLILQQLFLMYTMHSKLPSEMELLEEILAIEKDYFEAIWKELLSNREYVAILRFLSRNKSGVYSFAKKKGINASRAITGLEGMGIIFKEKKEYQFYDPVFELWLNSHGN